MNETASAPALSEDAIEAIARRVVELLSTGHVVTGADNGHLVDAAGVARKYAVSPAWVYEHAAELGAIRLGTGAKPRLRFDLEKVSEAMPSCSPSRGSQPSESPADKPRSPRRAGQAMGTKTDLLPVRGSRTPKAVPARPPEGSER